MSIFRFHKSWWLVVVLSLAAATCVVCAVALVISDFHTLTRGCTDNGKRVCVPNWFLNLVLPIWIVWFGVLAGLDRFTKWSVLPLRDGR